MKLMHPFKNYQLVTKSVTLWTKTMIPMCHPCFAGDTKTTADDKIIMKYYPACKEFIFVIEGNTWSLVYGQKYPVMVCAKT